MKRMTTKVCKSKVSGADNRCYNNCTQVGAPRKGINNSRIVPSGGGCRCNTVSASTPSCSPYFNYQVRYSESGDHAVPCIANQSRTLPEAKHNVSTPRQVRGKCGLGCPQDPPFEEPCPGGSKFCSGGPTLGNPPCADTSLGAVAYFAGSSVQKGALAGTIAAMDYVQIQSSDACGTMVCPGGTKDGNRITYNSGLGLWTPFFDDKDLDTLQFQSEEDANAVLGDGATDPLYLDRDYLASHLEEILGPARLAHAGYIKAGGL